MRMSINNVNKKAAFTLIEILVVMGIVGIIVTVSFLSLSGYRQRSALDNAAQSIAAFLRDAYQRSINQESGSEWGVRFEQVADGRDFYALFSGPVYVSAASTRYLPVSVEFSDPVSGSKDIIFEKLTGLPTVAPFGITVFLTSDPSVSKTINVNAVGQIQY